MRLMINGQWQDEQKASNVTELLENLCLESRRVAVELNKAIVRRGDYGCTPLADGDCLEIVTLVGGG